MATKDALAQARKEAGLTQEDLARKVCVTRQAISRWETGETTPSIDMTKLLSAGMTRTGPRTPRIASGATTRAPSPTRPWTT